MIPGKYGSVDEQDIGFQGNHPDKQRIGFKRKGDGFLVDTYCLKGGYTYSFYLRNHPSPKKFLEKNYSPLHSRVLSLFEQLPSQNYKVGLDDLFISARFAKASEMLPQKVMIHGVARQKGRGVPKCVEQEVVASKNLLHKVRGTVKVAVLEGDEDCKNLVACSIYDTKPVYLISNACEEVKWVRKERKLWHKDKNQYVNVPFHRLNLINE